MTLFNRLSCVTLRNRQASHHLATYLYVKLHRNEEENKQADTKVHIDEIDIFIRLKDNSDVDEAGITKVLRCRARHSDQFLPNK